MPASGEGLFHRSRRPVKPEAVFGQMKAGKHYKRFRRFGKDPVTMDFAIFAIAFNTGKMFNRDRKAKKTAKTGSKNQPVGLWGITVVGIKITATQKIYRRSSQCLIQAAQIPSFSHIEKMKAALFEQPH
jgi:hypothetical protein